MDQFVRFLDLLRDVPAPAVAAGVVVAVVLLGWLLGRVLFRPRIKASDPPPLQRLKSQPPPAPPSDTGAIDGFREAMEAKDVAGADLDAMVREFETQLTDARVRLGEIGEADQDAQAALAAIRASLDGGGFNAALAALDALGGEKSETGREMRREAERRLMAAALTRLVAGDLALAARDPATAERQFRLAIETLPAGADALLAECLNKHGTAAYRANRLEIAAMSFRRAVKLLERLKGGQDGDVATALNNLAMLYFARDDLQAAEPLYRRALAIDEEVMGPDSTAVATDLNNLGLLLKRQDRLDEAEPLLKRALGIKEAALDAGHPSLVTGLRNYATVLRALGREEEAAAHDRRADVLNPPLSEAGDARDVSGETGRAENANPRTAATG